MAALSTGTYGQPHPELDTYVLCVPHGTGIDGAVVELHVAEDGTVTADIRIPARQELTHG